jgi:DNA-binding helix-hairpin-helix protein with protein kinase domain
MRYKNQLGKAINVDKNHLASKGQASIHKVFGEKKVAKLYHSLNYNKSNLLNEKLLFMIKNLPFNNSTNTQIKTSIVWPLEVIYKNNNFVGFTMPYMENYETLSELTILNRVDNEKKISKKFAKEKNDKFLYERLSICYNLASVLEVIHQLNKYVIIDLKPDNILIDINGNIALIDIDSIQVKGNNKIYHADAHTPDYAPPEHHNKIVDFKTNQIEPTWDYFVFALIAYQVIFQIPAFMGTVSGHTEITEHIKKQYFPNGQYAYRFSNVAPPHNDFEKLSKKLKNAFINTFEGKVNDRINFKIWKRYFLNEIELLSSSNKKKNSPTYKSNNNIILKIFKYAIAIVIIILILTIAFYIWDSREDNYEKDIIDGSI